MGLDSECDATIDAALPANTGIEPTIRRLRESLIAEHLGVEPVEVGRRYEGSGSLIATIEGLRGETGRSLELLDLVKPGAFDQYIAEHELLDPESPDAMFEAIPERGMRKNWHRGKAWVRRLRGR